MFLANTIFSTQKHLNCHLIFSTLLFFQEVYSEEQVKNIQTSEGKNLGDILALSIGALGENMNSPRAVRIIANDPGLRLVASTHPHLGDENTMSGRYGVILALKTQPGELTHVAKQLCGQVIGE